MKKSISLFLVLALSLSVVTPALALTLTPTTTRPAKPTIRDEKKRAIVERMSTRIGQINSNRSAIMLRHLSKIEETLNKIEARALKLEQSGKDISSVKTAIQKARTAIAAAKEKVNAQTTKTYSINITTEDKLGSAVSSTRILFAADLKAANQSVVNARKAVRDVLVALSKIVGEKLETTTEEK